MNLFNCCLEDCCLEDEKRVNQSQTEEVVSVVLTDPKLNIQTNVVYESLSGKKSSADYKRLQEPLLLHLITHVDLFLPKEIENQYIQNSDIHKPVPIRKIPTVDNLLSNIAGESSDTEVKPKIPKKSDPIPIDHTNTYL